MVDFKQLRLYVEKHIIKPLFTKKHFLGSLFTLWSSLFRPFRADVSVRESDELEKNIDITTFSYKLFLF